MSVLAGDTETEQIDYVQLAHGVLLHSGADGLPLPATRGGPLRAVFPVGVALQDDEGGAAAPADVSDVRLLTLTT